MLVINMDRRQQSVHVKLIGDIDTDPVDHFIRTMRELIADEPGLVNIGAEQLFFIFSNGLAVLVGALA